MFDALGRLAIASRLERVHLHDAMVHAALATLLDGRLPALDHLCLTFATLDESILADASDLHVPRSLELAYVELDADSLTALATETLQRIVLAAPGPRALAALLQAPALAELTLTGSREGGLVLDDSSCRELGRAGALRRLAAAAPIAVDHLEAIVERHPLEALHVGGPPSDVIELLAVCARPDALRELALGPGELTSAALESLATSPVFSRLRRLRAPSSGFTAGELAAELPELADLVDVSG